jgi:transcriptional regulator with XRE-family HTH domain
MRFMMTNASHRTFGELLRRWRREHGLSQARFGQLLEPKARHSTVSCWEAGIRRPCWRFLGQIVAITGIPSHLALGAPAGSEAKRNRPSGANVDAGVSERSVV